VLNKNNSSEFERYEIKPGCSQKVFESEQEGHRATERLGNLWQ